MSADVNDPSPISGWDRRRQLLLSEYEQVALELLAARGFKSVTFDDIAEASGVSARTLFRYFPTKDDCLLGFPRRGVDATVEALAALEPSRTPLIAAWHLVRDIFLTNPVEVGHLTLWRQAAADAPDVVARVRGERIQLLLDAAAEYCGRSVGVDPANDIGCRIAGGVFAGVELAVVEAWGRSEMPLAEIIEAADRSIRALDASLTPRT